MRLWYVQTHPVWVCLRGRVDAKNILVDIPVWTVSFHQFVFKSNSASSIFRINRPPTGDTFLEGTFLGDWNLRQQKLLFPKSSLSARLFEGTFTLHKTNTFHLAEENHRLKLVPIFGMGIWHSSQEIYCQSVMMNLISYRLSTLLKGTWHQFPSFHRKSLAFLVHAAAKALMMTPRCWWTWVTPFRMVHPGEVNCWKLGKSWKAVMWLGGWLSWHDFTKDVGCVETRKSGISQKNKDSQKKTVTSFETPFDGVPFSHFYLGSFFS